MHALATLLHRYGAIAAFDYASAGSCKQIECTLGGQQAGTGLPDHAGGPAARAGRAFSDVYDDGSLDAVMLSPHKLPGGPGSAGVLVIRRSIIRSNRPQSPGESLSAAPVYALGLAL